MLKLGEQTHDLVVSNFQFQEITKKTEDLGQRLKIKLLWFKNEWFLDQNYGIPYFEEIFVKGVTKETIDDIFRVAVVQESGVDTLLAYSSEFNRTTREFIVNIKIKTTEGEILAIPLSL